MLHSEFGQQQLHHRSFTWCGGRGLSYHTAKESLKDKMSLNWNGFTFSFTIGKMVMIKQ